METPQGPLPRPDAVMARCAGSGWSFHSKFAAIIKKLNKINSLTEFN
ncbi:hypothetical protein [Pseudomonas sp. 5P_5.1_Bac1]|nr:hypothetical protein [Pseudomonas sp. 5P_5.1_Bac1]MCU1721704.1 hypothetical protein [Pseudomonas sp. 5P_5.1_Bac1]